MKYLFYLRNTETGETKTYHENYDWDDEGDMFFQWFENNYSCDCNRSLFMYEHEEDKELDCSGDKNIIVIDKIENEEGETVWEAKNDLA